MKIFVPDQTAVKEIDVEFPRYGRHYYDYSFTVNKVVQHDDGKFTVATIHIFDNGEVRFDFDEHDDLRPQDAEYLLNSNVVSEEIWKDACEQLRSAVEQVFAL